MAELLLNLLQFISEHSNSPFFTEYTFWFSFFNLVILLLNFGVLFFTLLYLKKYTEETELTRKQIARQTELEQMPIMLLFIRNISDGGVPFGDLQKKRDKNRNFLIRIRTETEDSDYYLRLRNTGKGTAFNVIVESDIFDIVDYETQFFAPQKDEHSIKIIQKENQKIESWEMFENSVFTIKCNDLAGNSYQFKYRIIDFKKRKIEYLGNTK